MNSRSFERLVLTKDLIDDNSFTISEKYREIIDCDTIECFKNKTTQTGIKIMRKELALHTADQFIDMQLEDDEIRLSTLAAGINLRDLRYDLFGMFMDDPPLMLISDKGCAIDFLEFEYSKERNQYVFRCLCKCKADPSCDFEKKLCNGIEDDQSSFYKQAVEFANIISTGPGEKKGLIPFIKYSTFLDFVIWKSNFGNAIKAKYSKNIGQVGPP